MSEPVIKIVVDHLAGTRAGERQEFELGSPIRFGRHPDNEVAFDLRKELEASSRHAELREDPDGYVLVDIGSSNGTYSNGAKIDRKPIPLGTPVDITFGVGGPRISIYIGDPRVLAAPVPITIVAGKQKEAPSTMQQGAGKRRGAEPELGPDGKPKPLTVSVMIARARSHATQAPREGGFSKTSVFMKTMVDQALHQSSRRFKLVVIALSTVLVVSVGGLVFLALRQNKSDEAMNSRLTVLGLEAGPQIFEANRQALYLFAYCCKENRLTKVMQEEPFCTGFSVTPDHLATNAHCVEAIDYYRTKAKKKVFVVRNQEPKARYDIGETMVHPKYNGTAASADVALVKVAGPLPKQVRLAGPERLRKLMGGQAIFLFGFPGLLAVPSKPEATITAGAIGRMTDTKGVTTIRSGDVDDETPPSSFEDSCLVQHSAFTMEGTSGSPIFDAHGLVIAVNNGQYKDKKEVAVKARQPDGGLPGADSVAEITNQLAGYAYGIRVDKVWEILEMKGIAPKADDP